MKASTLTSRAPTGKVAAHLRTPLQLSDTKSLPSGVAPTPVLLTRSPQRWDPILHDSPAASGPSEPLLRAVVRRETFRR
ncbi:MAG: hypothetical protein QXG48_04360 [Thermofilaceae archaeon]